MTLNITFNQSALDTLRRKLEADQERHQQTGQGVIGRKVRPWAASVWKGSAHTPDLSNLNESGLSRSDVLSICHDQITPLFESMVSICAWGSMKRDHARTFFESYGINGQVTPVKAALEELRNSRVSRREDFSTMQTLRQSGVLQGVDIAYFTKFLFFLRPAQDAYILDQWTAKSINFLVKDDLIILSKDGYVTGRNTPDQYETFCNLIDKLAETLGFASGAIMEEKIFSQGGRNPYPWRRLIKDSFPKTSGPS